MSERQSLPGKPELLLRIILLFVPLVVCLSEITASESIAQLLYSMHALCFHVYTGCLVTNLQFKFLLTLLSWRTVVRHM